MKLEFLLQGRRLSLVGSGEESDPIGSEGKGWNVDVGWWRFSFRSFFVWSFPPFYFGEFVLEPQGINTSTIGRVYFSRVPHACLYF